MIRYAIVIAICGLILTGAKRADQSVTPQSKPSVQPPLDEHRDATVLREKGPQALAALFDRRDKLMEQLRKSPSLEAQAGLRSNLKTLESLIDEVGGQRYCTASRLFWHTDFAKAKAAAAASGKPILSLRMMGKLTEELSCANSRFFRTTLYANQEVSEYLRERFVLHWQSVRPVPKLTIDFGDGRKLVRTLTGNSAHYVLTPDGKPLDVLPGLYGPTKFLSLLKGAEAAAQTIVQFDAEQLATRGEQIRAAVLSNYHSRRLREILSAWERDLRQAKLENTRLEPASGPAKDVKAPPAEAAAVVARPKKLLEFNIIRDVTMRTAPLEKQTDETMWRAIADLHRQDGQLDAASIALIRKQNVGRAQAASRLSITKGRVEDPVLRILASYQSSVAMDTVRNEYQLHRKIHEWFLRGEAAADVEQLNERVYAELFLTPSSDPWVGLVDSDTYTALENDGIEIDERKHGEK